MRTLLRHAAVTMGLIAGGFAAPLPLAAQAPSPAIRQAPLVFVATLSEVVEGPVGLSSPPVRSYRLGFEKADKPLRGTLPESLQFSYSIRAEIPPAFTVGQRYLVAARLGQGQQAIEILPATGETLKSVQAELSLPIGWILKSGKPFSPWAMRGDAAWPKESELQAEATCAGTGRPALFAGEGITIEVEQVPPKNLKQFQNPFGDGQFKITVTNTTNAARTVPALLKDGDTIRWHDSLVIMCHNSPYWLPSEGPLKNPQPVALGPGESVSTTIDTLRLSDGVAWPRGGSRILFTFALGEVAADNFFYYFSSLHDRMRAERKRADAEREP